VKAVAGHPAPSRPKHRPRSKTEKRREKRNNNPSPAQAAKQKLLGRGGICWNCKLPGHERKDCAQPRTGKVVLAEPPTTPPPLPTPPAPMLTTPAPSLRSGWDMFNGIKAFLTGSAKPSREAGESVTEKES
jgi:hypothetical protein